MLPLFLALERRFLLKIRQSDDTIYTVKKGNKQIGKVTKKTSELLGLDYQDEKPIFIGEANIAHMKEEHPEDYKKYGSKISEIIVNPTYLARNEKKKSIEYIKEYKVDNEYVLVAVRVSNNDVHFARTMYVMADEKVERYKRHNYFYKV